jgi:hypothetical protein
MRKSKRFYCEDALRCSECSETLHAFTPQPAFERCVESDLLYCLLDATEQLIQTAAVLNLPHGFARRHRVLVLLI